MLLMDGCLNYSLREFVCSKGSSRQAHMQEDKMTELGFEYSVGDSPAKDWVFLSCFLSWPLDFLAFRNRRKGSLISYLFEPFIIVVHPGRRLSTLILFLSKELYHGQAVSSIDSPP